jgi:hypothetical protein
MKWNERIVRVEIRNGEGKVTDCPKDVTVLIVNHDKQVNDVDLGWGDYLDPPNPPVDGVDE